MAGPLQAKVIIAKCSKTRKAFGIRVEKKGRDWVRTWAFPIDESKAARDGYSADEQVSMGGATDEYPGCPHCGNGGKDGGAHGGTAFCDCGKISCCGGMQNFGSFLEQTCPWCGNVGQYNITNESLDVNAGGY